MRGTPRYWLIGLLAAVAVFGAVYILTPAGGDGGTLRTLGTVGAILILLVLVALVSGGRRPERRGEERNDG